MQNRLTEHDMRGSGEVPPDWKEEFDERKDKEKFRFDQDKFMKLEGFDPAAGIQTQELH